MTQMLQELKGTPSKEAIYQHTIQSDDNEIFNVSMVPDLTDMITKEESGVNWLDTVEHMLVNFPMGAVQTHVLAQLFNIGLMKKTPKNLRMNL